MKKYELFSEREIAVNEYVLTPPHGLPINPNAAETVQYNLDWSGIKAETAAVYDRNDTFSGVSVRTVVPLDAKQLAVLQRSVSCVYWPSTNNTGPGIYRN